MTQAQLWDRHLVMMAARMAGMAKMARMAAVVALCVSAVQVHGFKAASPEEAKAPEFAQEFGARVRFSRG